MNRFVESQQLESNPKPEAIAELSAAATLLKEITAILGIFREPVQLDDPKEDDSLTNSLMQILLDLRQSAKKNKDFATADKIRDAVTALGIKIEDRPGGSTWSRS